MFRIRGTHQFVSAGLKDQYETDQLHVDVNMVDGFELDTEAFKNGNGEYASRIYFRRGQIHLQRRG